MQTSAIAAVAAVAFLPLVAVAGAATGPLEWPAGCIWEEETPLGPALDALWGRVRALAGARKASEPRPRFCFDHRPRWSGGRRILSGFDARNRAAAVMLTPEELAEFGPCLVVHEMLHALLGLGQEAVIKRMSPCPGAERGAREEG